jgi:hypothetical protein
MTFTQILNRNQAFRLIPKKLGVVYANGTFYLPQGFAPRPDGTISQLQDVIAVPILSDITTEKGENLYFPDRDAWGKKSLFGLMKKMSEHSKPSSPLEWGELGKAIKRFDLTINQCGHFHPWCRCEMVGLKNGSACSKDNRCTATIAEARRERGPAWVRPGTTGAILR